MKMSLMGMMSMMVVAVAVLLVLPSEGRIISTSLVLRQAIISPDGAPRLGITVNGTMPGPVLTAEVYDTLEITVVNEMSLATSVHWHGVGQDGTPFMDGTAMVTQCPIPPSQSFTYQFDLTAPGTFYYHAHLGGQNADGLVGALVVLDPHEAATFAYAQDYVVLLQDWFHADAMTIDLMKSQGYVTTLTMDSALINGQGHYANCGGYVAPSASTPLSCASNASDPATYPTFLMEPGKAYRFRFICAATTFHFNVSLDGHRMTVISTDGNRITPTTVDSILMYSGERYDVIVQANQVPDNYWLRAELPNGSNGVQAIVSYSTAPVALPASLPADPANMTTFSLMSATSLEYNVPSYTKEVVVDVAKVTPDPLNPGERWTMNGITFQFPNQPLFQSLEGTTANTYTVDLMMADVVLLILNNLDPHDAHPFHLHGHSFWVVGMGSNYSTSPSMMAGDYRNFTRHNAVLKDTVVVPAGGWVAFIFNAKNPGYWLFHCHVEWHMAAGMTMLFQEATSYLPSLPAGFPTCYPFPDPYNEMEPPVNCTVLTAPLTAQIDQLTGQVIGLSVALAVLGAALIALGVVIYVRSKHTAGDPMAFKKDFAVELD